MADLKKCDKCGRILEVESADNWVSVWLSIHEDGATVWELDLCPDCRRSLEHTLKERGFLQ